jgi:glycosyltransferase involved in cell wall biosynthesis
MLNVVFVGRDDGNKKYIYNRIEQLGLSELFIHYGLVSEDNLLHLYEKASMLVYPSITGPDNLPPIEAFALGCPVIASNIPGSREQLGDAALLFDPFNENELAEKIYILYTNDKLRESLIKKGIERVNNWTPESYVKSIISIFDEFSKIARMWGNNDLEIKL